MAQRIFGTRRQPRRARWVVLLLAVAAVGLVAAAAYAQPVAPAPQAGLLLRAEPEGPPVPAPILSTLVDIAVGGPVARTRVRQAFGNTAQAWLEGVYLFPLPEGAAVDRFRLRIGEQVIEGRIAEREAAEREYRTARKEGKLAGLLDRERPNVFTLSVANIPPGATVEVEIEYQETLRFQDGQLTLRFRMVVAPRYRPRGPVLANTGPEGGGIAPPFAPTPVMPPAGGAPNPLALRIALDPGFPLARLESRYHEVAIAELPDDRYAVRLAQGPVLADRDFELVWAPALGTAPAVGLFTEIVDGEGYLLAMIVPPEQPAASAPPRELVLVVDTSGSMAGTSLPQAKAALRHALARLRPRDRFNVIRFADTPSALFPTAREASERNRGRAAMFIDALDAEGGTEMAAALMWALATRAPDGYLRQIVFLTDGAIGNEAELFDLIRAGIGSSRLFTVGIGSAPNGYFMAKAARLGRGGYSFIADLAEVRERMDALFNKLARPVLTDLSVAWPKGAAAEVWPTELPDLYEGEPVVFTARLATLSGTAILRGTLGGQPWQVALDLAAGVETAGAAKLWARDKIAALTDRLHDGADPATIRLAALPIALRHRLATPYTSLVAVDVTPRRGESAPLHQRSVPRHLPDGWVEDKVFGPTDAVLDQATASGLSLIRAKVSLGLPQGATPAPWHMALAGMLLAGASLLWMLRRRLV